jgi:hypothetical protein
VGVLASPVPFVPQKLQARHKARHAGNLFWYSGCSADGDATGGPSRASPTISAVANDWSVVLPEILGTKVLTNALNARLLVSAALLNRVHAWSSFSRGDGSRFAFRVRMATVPIMT